MKLRGYLGVSIMISFISWLPFFIGYGFVMAYLEDYTVRQAFLNSFIPSVMFAILYGFTMGIFYRVDTVYVNKNESKDIKDKLIIEMAKLGYHPDNQVENVITFKPNIYAGRAAGNISVIYKDGELILTGPRFHIRNLKKRL